jgi:hypothetical protein
LLFVFLPSDFTVPRFSLALTNLQIAPRIILAFAIAILQSPPVTY